MRRENDMYPPIHEKTVFFVRTFEFQMMARTNHLYMLTDNGLIVGGAILFLEKDKLNIGRIFVSPEHYRKGYGVYMMQEIETMFSNVKEFVLDTPIWNVRTNAFYTKLGYVEVSRDNEFIYYIKKCE